MNLNVFMHAEGILHTDHPYNLQAMTKGGGILQACYRREHEREMRVSRDHPVIGCQMAVLSQVFLREILVQETFGKQTWTEKESVPRPRDLATQAY